MALKKWIFVKANIGDLLSVNGTTLTTPSKLHAFKEADTERYVYGWEGNTSGNFHIFNKTSFNQTPKKTITGYLTLTASLSDTVYNAEKLTDTVYTFDAATREFEYDSIVAANISDVPTDIDLKTGKSKTTTTTDTTTTKAPLTASSAIASIPTWGWFLIVPAVGYLGYLAVKAIFKKNKKKVVSK